MKSMIGRSPSNEYRSHVVSASEATTYWASNLAVYNRKWWTRMYFFMQKLNKLEITQRSEQACCYHFPSFTVIGVFSPGHMRKKATFCYTLHSILLTSKQMNSQKAYFVTVVLQQYNIDEEVVGLTMPYTYTGSACHQCWEQHIQKTICSAFKTATKCRTHLGENWWKWQNAETHFLHWTSEP